MRARQRLRCGIVDSQPDYILHNIEGYNSKSIHEAKPCPVFLVLWTYRFICLRITNWIQSKTPQKHLAD